MTSWKLAVMIAAVSAGLAGCSDDGQRGGNGRDAQMTDRDTGSVDADADDGGRADVDADTTTDADADDAAADVGAADTTVDVDGPCRDDDDCDYDGLLDCEEAQQGTEICDPDTDGDHLNDLQEILAGSDPTVADSDGDGVDDGREVDLGLDPTSPESYPDGQNDGDRWVVGACDSPAGEPVDFYTSNNVVVDPTSASQPNVGNWQVALPPAFGTYQELDISGLSTTDGVLDDRQAAAVYADPSNEVAGFLLSYTPPDDQAEPTDVLQAHHGAIEAIGSVEQEYNGGQFNTHDFRPAALGRYLVTADSAQSYQAVRDGLLMGMAPFAADDISGLPAATGADYDQFRIYVSAIYREYDDDRPPQVLTSVAVAPASKFNNRQTVQFRMDDLSNTTNIAESSDDHQVRCRLKEPKESTKADFYWMLDQSGSMSDDYSRVQTVANGFYEQLNNTGLDFRLGVANMDEATDGRLRSVGWHTGLETFLDEITAVKNWNGDTGSEYGLKNAQKGIQYMLGLDAQSPADDQRIRPDATLITIFLSDEKAQSLKNNPLSGSTGQQLLADWTSFFQQNTVAFSIVGDGGNCGEQARGYKQIAQTTGGSFASLCATDISETIEDIIYAATGYTGYQLSETPISSSLRVYINGQWVPRSRDNGFDYFAQTNSLAFFGSYRPQTPQGNQAPDHIAVSYQTWQDRSKGGGDTP